MADGRGRKLALALEAGLTGETGAMSGLFTDDVSGWSPNMHVNSLAELNEVVQARDESLSDVNVAVQGVDAAGNKAFAEFVLTAKHSGPWVIDEDVVIEPTGREIVMAGVVSADFSDDKISAFRMYCDDLALMAQLLPEE
jgi:SnoaL-like polyketide cyclase